MYCILDHFLFIETSNVINVKNVRHDKNLATMDIEMYNLKKKITKIVKK